MYQTGIPRASYVSIIGIVAGVVGAVVLAGACAIFYNARQRRLGQLAQAVQPPVIIEEPTMTQLYDAA